MLVKNCFWNPITYTFESGKYGSNIGDSVITCEMTETFPTNTIPKKKKQIFQKILTKKVNCKI